MRISGGLIDPVEGLSYQTLDRRQTGHGVVDCFRSLMKSIASRLVSLTGLGALAVNLSCAFSLAPYRAHGGSLTRAAFLSARNDALASVAIIVAAGFTLYARSAWPDLIVGLGIAAMNADAAREVYAAARDEHLASAKV